VASPDGGVRFVLVVSLSQRTHTARTIDTLGGRSVQHIGIGCSNIIPTVSNLRAAGVEFVPISPNYYDDLLASRDIDPALVTRMRDLGIVYDRSPDGEYFQSMEPVSRIAFSSKLCSVSEPTMPTAP
jgi:4-hydroxyphenylpyruvate dioxygenase